MSLSQADETSVIERGSFMAFFSRKLWMGGLCVRINGFSVDA
jgi:hypothetical protein